MNNVMEYNGYYTKIEYSVEDGVLYGKLEGINDLVTFESDSIKKIEKEFHNAVDDYIDYCESKGVEPNKTYSGKFNVRIDPELHKQIVIEAYMEDVSLNQCVQNAIERYVKSKRHKKRA